MVIMVIHLVHLWVIVIRRWEAAVVGCASHLLYQKKIT